MLQGHQMAGLPSQTQPLTLDFFIQKCLHSFSLIAVWLCNFWGKNMGAKAACKMLMKLTTGVNFSSKSYLQNVGEIDHWCFSTGWASGLKLWGSKLYNFIHNKKSDKNKVFLATNRILQATIVSIMLHQT